MKTREQIEKDKNVLEEIQKLEKLDSLPSHFHIVISRDHQTSAQINIEQYRDHKNFNMANIAANTIGPLIVEGLKKYKEELKKEIGLEM